jgi:MFS family permease
MKKRDGSFLRTCTAFALVTTIILIDIPMLAIAQEEEGDNTGEEMELESNNTGEEREEMANGDLISRVSEYIGIFALGFSLGLLVSPSVIIRRISTTIPDLIIRRSIVFISIAVLTISAGIIHILLVKEHMEESYVWGIGFLVMGVSQLIYGGIFILLARKLEERLTKRRAAMNLLFGIGITGNALLVAIFIYARLFVPPFSPEGIPVEELEANGIVTVIIELFLIGLLVYLAKGFGKETVIIDRQKI